MAAAGLGGYVLCGINSTRRGEALAADIRRADCQIVVTDAEHRPLLDGLDLDGVQVLDTLERRLGAHGRGGRRPDAVPRGRPDGHLHADLHVGNERQPETRAGVAFHGVDVGPGARREVRGHRGRHLLPVDAAVPLQRVGRGLGCRGRQRRGDGAREVLGVELRRRHPPLRRHLHELCRQAAGLHPGHARTARRRENTAAHRVRQRGQRPGHRGSSSAGSTARCGTASVPPRTRSSSPAKTAHRKAHWAKGFRAWRSTTPKPSPNARLRASTPTVH